MTEVAKDVVMANPKILPNLKQSVKSRNRT